MKILRLKYTNLNRKMKVKKIQKYHHKRINKKLDKKKLKANLPHNLKQTILITMNN